LSSPSETSTSTTSGRSLSVACSASALDVATPAIVRPSRSSKVRAARRKLRLSSTIRQRTAIRSASQRAGGGALQPAGIRKGALAVGLDRRWHRCHRARSPRSFPRPRNLDSGETAMEPILISDPELADDATDDELLTQSWRAEQLRRLGLTRILAETFAGLVDWHEIAALVARGCPPELALEIAL